jgi:hypothetical protein
VNAPSGRPPSDFFTSLRTFVSLMIVVAAERRNVYSVPLGQLSKAPLGA